MGHGKVLLQGVGDLDMNLDWPGLPDVGAVVADGAVGGEFADARHVQHGHACPVCGVAEGLIDAILAIDVGLVVGKKHVGIVVEKRLHERVKEAESEASKATKQAEAARNQVSEETLRLQRSVTQMQAARDVAELEYEIAQKNIEATRTRMESSTANLHDLGDAQAQASERLITLQDVTFELERSQIALLRATGDLESWAVGTK